jgi:hypothetical protein
MTEIVGANAAQIGHTDAIQDFHMVVSPIYAKSLPQRCMENPR